MQKHFEDIGDSQRFIKFAIQQLSMKTPKEIQLAAITFLRAFQDYKANELEGDFIAYSPLFLYKQYQYYLGGAILFGLLFLYLFYNAVFVDAVYYWHVDLPVVMGFVIIFVFLLIFTILLQKFLKTDKIIKTFLANPDQSPYGVIITEEYYFENNPNEYHIISRSNIIRIDYEEETEKEIYLEIILDTGKAIEVRGIRYQKDEFDVKNWIKTRPKVAVKDSKPSI